MKRLRALNMVGVKREGSKGGKTVGLVGGLLSSLSLRR